MDKIISISIDRVPTSVNIIPKHWNHGHTGFENVNVPCSKWGKRKPTGYDILLQR